MRLLFLTTVLPAAGRSGGEIVSQSVIDALVQGGHEVRVLGYRRPGDDFAGRGDACVGQRPIETSGAGLRPAVWMASALARRTPYSTAKYRSRAYRSAVRREHNLQPAAVFVDHAQAHFALDSIRASSRPLVFIAHNAEAEGYARLATAADRRVARWIHRREARLIREVEVELARRARQIWTLTEADAAYFRSLQPGADVRALEVSSRMVAPPTEAPTCDIGLIGSWSWRANAVGLEWFAAEVVPRLPDQVRIEVAGRGAQWLRDRHPNLVVHGVVPDARSFLARSRVVAVPALAGGGVQIKTLDAIAAGVPVVTTPVGVRGLGELPRSTVVVEDAADFALQLSQLAADGDRQRPDPDAIAWSSGRRARFRDSVATWTQDVTRTPRPGQTPGATPKRASACD